MMKPTQRHLMLWATLLTLGWGLSACTKTVDTPAKQAETPVPVAQEQPIESEAIAPQPEAAAEPQKEAGPQKEAELQKETVAAAEPVSAVTPPPVAKPELKAEAKPVREVLEAAKPAIQQPVKKIGQPVKAEIVEKLTPKMDMPAKVQEQAPEVVQEVVEAAPTAPKPEPVIPQSYVTKITHADALGSRDVLAADENVVILDIRTAKEFNSGHLKGAVNVDFYADDFEQQLSKLDRSTEYLMHCRSGGRSSRSLKTFKKLGFKHIIHMDGGIKAWNKAKLPTTK
jgi:rhodanese-related sulfurtransferase